MAFSTKHYHLKPIVPHITAGFYFDGMRLIKMNTRSRLLLSAPFQSSILFYYIKDKRFSENINQYIDTLNHIKETDDYLYGDDYKMLKTTIDEIVKICFGEKASSIEKTATPKELNFWIKKTFKQRKRKIRSLYPKKEYFEFHSFLNNCNSFLKLLGEHSLKFTDSMSLFFEIGSDVDWFLLNITECSYHQSTEFKNLFNSSVRVNNDLVSVSGILNILNQPSIIELYLSEEKSIVGKVRQYRGVFQELLLSGNKIIDLETMRIEAEKDSYSKEVIKIDDKEEKLREIQSMHDIAVDRKIQDIN